jgi:hypothetical protein
MSDLNENWNVLIYVARAAQYQTAVVTCVQEGDTWRDEANRIGAPRRYEQALKPTKPGYESNSFHSNLNFV